MRVKFSSTILNCSKFNVTPAPIGSMAMVTCDNQVHFFVSPSVMRPQMPVGIHIGYGSVGPITECL